MNNIKIAIVHDWLTGMRGGEKCLEVFCELFPNATVFTLLHEEGSVSGIIENMEIKTSFLQKIPGISRNYRKFLPLFPAAIESFDLSGYDLVLSSSHCAAKGIKSPKGSLHVCYCYTPVRYVWTFFDEYFSRENPLKRRVISYFANRIKSWDLKTNKNIDYFIAISHNVQNRIKEYYNRDSDVIYPPVSINELAPTSNLDEGYYLIVSALVPYKKVDLAIEAFNKNGKKLIVIGNGNDYNHLSSIAKSNIEIKGWVDSKELQDYYSKCSALIFPGEEDFGIVPVEAQSYGKPVVAYEKGGALETVVPFADEKATGVFFNEQTIESLNEAIDVFERNRNSFNAEHIKENAHKFNRDRFKEEIKCYVENKWQMHISQN